VCRLNSRHYSNGKVEGVPLQRSPQLLLKDFCRNIPAQINTLPVVRPRYFHSYANPAREFARKHRLKQLINKAVGRLARASPYLSSLFSEALPPNKMIIIRRLFSSCINEKGETELKNSPNPGLDDILRFAANFRIGRTYVRISDRLTPLAIAAAVFERTSSASSMKSTSRRSMGTRIVSAALVDPGRLMGIAMHPMPRNVS
jgi:hypothetical protein